MLNLIGRTRMSDALRRAHGKPGLAELRRILARLLGDIRSHAASSSAASCAWWPTPACRLRW